MKREEPVTGAPSEHETLSLELRARTSGLHVGSVDLHRGRRRPQGRLPRVNAASPHLGVTETRGHGGSG